MRYLTVLLLLALPAAAAAQPAEREGRPAPRQHDARATPRATAEPRIGQPLLPAGWQWFGSSRRGPSIGQPMLPAGQEWFGTPGRDRRPHRPGGWFRPYAGYGAGYFAAPYESEAPAEQEYAMQTTGLLRLEITPATGLQYYVDGEFIGTSSELGLEFELNAGPRRVEIRSPGFKALVFDKRIEAGRVATYRGALEPLDTAAAPPARPTGSSTFYVIPGCFMGNTPPRQENLPKGCDIGRVRTR